MIQLITKFSVELFPFVNNDLTEDLNKFLIELPTINIFEQITNEIISSYKISTKSNKKIVKLVLDYEAINNAMILANILKVNVAFIYEWVYRRQIEYRGLAIEDFED